MGVSPDLRVQVKYSHSVFFRTYTPKPNENHVISDVYFDVAVIFVKIHILHFTNHACFSFFVLFFFRLCGHFLAENGNGVAVFTAEQQSPKNSLRTQNIVLHILVSE